MPRPYPPEFRARAIALVRAGKQVKQTAYELGISAGCLHQWLKQDLIDRGEMPGKSTAESADLRAARKKIRELETELAIIRQAAKFLSQDKPHPKGFTRRGHHPAQSARGNRPFGRRRVPRRQLLPNPWSVPTGLLPIQTPADLGHAVAPTVAHWVDQGGPRGFSRDLWLSAHPCRADHGDGHQVQFSVDLGADDAGRDLWTSRACPGQATTWRRDC